MSKVTSKLQVTIPKEIADRHRIRPGDEIEWVSAGDSIRIVPAAAKRPRLSVEERLRLFDEATKRQREREAKRGRRRNVKPAASRGWTREELYDRGRPR